MERILFSIVAVIIGLSLSMSFVGCGGTRDIVNKAKEMNAERFKFKCEAAEYKSLIKSSDSFVDKKLKVEVLIAQDVGNGYYRAYAGNPSDEPKRWYENEYLIRDVSENGLGLSEGDAVTIYGIYGGFSVVYKTLFDDSDGIPEIEAIQKGKLQSEETINHMVDSLVLNKHTYEWGDSYCTGGIKNTTGIDFGTFGIEINCIGANGISLGNYSWYIKNWKPNKKATVKFELIPEGTEKIEITDTGWYSD